MPIQHCFKSCKHAAALSYAWTVLGNRGADGPATDR